MVDLVVKRSDSKDYLILVKDGDDAVINITGYTFYMMVKEDIDDEDYDAKIDKTVTSHTDPTNGETMISLSSSDTTLPPTSPTQKYVYDIIMRDTSNNDTTLLSGVFTIQKRTRETIT